MKTEKEIKIDYEKEMNFGDGANITDGIHTMSELYFHRMFLFSKLCSIAVKQGRKAFRSKLHADGNMFPHYFIVGIETPEGNYSYHYHERFWSYFDSVPEIDRAPEWKGEAKDDLHLLNLIFG